MSDRMESDPTHDGRNGPVEAVLPIADWLPRYDRSWLPADVLAGITVAAAVLPEGMAYASLAGLPPETGLYAGLLALVVYVFVGTSRQVIYGPTSALAVLVATGVGSVAVGGSAIEYATLIGATTVLVGVISVIAWLFRLGFVVNFISESVLTGFSAGAALYITATQLDKLVGISGASGTFFERVGFVVAHLGATNFPTLGIGLGALVLLALGERYAKRVPTALIVVLLATGLVAVTDLQRRGVTVVGRIPSGLPPISLPTPPTGTLPDLVPVALALFLLSYVEGMGAVETFARRHDQRVDADQELLADGLTNIAAGIGHGFVVGGSMSRSALNDEIGGETQLVSGVSAVVLALVLVFFTDLFTTLPETVLAAVVIVAVAGLVDVPELRRIYRLDTLEFVTAASAFLGVLIFGMLAGVFIGVFVSLLVVVGRATYPNTATLGRVPGSDEFGDLSRHPENERVPGVLVYRVDAELFFANAPTIRAEVIDAVNDRETPVSLVVFDMRSSPTIDLTAADMLASLAEDLDERGIDFRLAEADGAVRDVLTAADASGPFDDMPLNERVVTVIEEWERNR
ncbi:SulP family inorganic anion transporter [Haladaptatus sp. T7]|uniref:SulP family inorganic anion transporter n=1 Tax=Haladaptatus sp. T7 TaxID=2029368 RepID=UPI002232B6BA|nr:SulP family inorganic anion transporter [Haladaptatus sp. T7]